ncbi:MAG: restriction endonuclease subunit S, partial [Bacteroidales bacterium]
GLKICKIPTEYIGALLNQRNAILRAKKGLLINEYLYCYMNSQRVVDYVQEKSKSLMQPNLSPKDLALLQIPLPNLETQQQIVAEIEREQAAVDSAKELIEIFTKKITNRIAQIWNE